MRIQRRSTRLHTLATLAILSLFVCSAIKGEAASAHSTNATQQSPHSFESVSDTPTIPHSSAIRIAVPLSEQSKHAPDFEGTNCGAGACVDPSAEQHSSVAHSGSALKFAADTNSADKEHIQHTAAASASLVLRPRILAVLPGEHESSTGDAALEAEPSSSSSGAGDESAALDSVTAADTNSTSTATDGVTGAVAPGGADGGGDTRSSSRRGHTLLEWIVIPCAILALTVLMLVAVVTTRRCREKRRMQREKDAAIAAGVGMVVAAHGKFPYVNPLSPPTIVVETCPLPPIQVLPRASVYGRGSIGGSNGGFGAGSDGFGDVRTRVPNNTICAYDALSWEELRGNNSGQWATRHSVHGDGRTASIAETIDVTVADQMMI